MKTLAKFISIALCVTAMTSCEKEPNKTVAEEELLRVPFVSKESKSQKDFFLYLPKGYRDDSLKKWPVMMFLHGDGERGNSKEDLGFVLMHGPLYEAWVQRRDLPFIIISPQLPLFGRDTLGIPYLVNRKMADFPDRLKEGIPDRPKNQETPEPMAPAKAVTLDDLRLPANGWDRIEEDLLIILDTVLNGYRTDASRVYLTGLSYGGFGTWHLASKHPRRFAAISPIVGWGHPDLMPSIAQENLPVWVFSGGRDGVVRKEFFLPGVNILEELGHTNLRYTVHEDMGHDTWTRVYAGDDLYNWLLQFSKE